ncbi:Fructose-bisphosphate aldolase-lysine N-methyltransferase, chloroplastic [Porphyridium purpureum]|uniref:Fructose-bisphosphate aldolase-lysine N-methyltransferase, chloroplastic n=1 Tax=Porphyridium purpureum TaxID=35688 RepID=A0A5J4Z1D1_PORPP|nr:Fructose-bisphosphate aldolase-lysine N-methyltransferase, chloroplastic [Porphyridium purpureum]|eukprot:POR5039..scf295_1
MVARMTAQSGAPSAAQTAQKHEQVLRWLKAEKGVTTGASLNKAGVGLVVDEALRPEQDILSVPLTLCITPSSARKALSVDLEREGFGSGSGRVLVVLQILYERALGRKSDKHALIESLVCLHDTNSSNALALWNDGEIAWLKGSSAYGEAKAERDGLQQEFALLKETVFSRKPEVFTEQDFSFELYQWASSALDAMGFTLTLPEGTGLALVPALHLVSQAETGINCSKRVGRQGLFRTTPVASLVSSTRLEKGDPLVVAYEASDALELFVKRGVVANSGALRQAVVLDFSLTDMDPFVDDKLDIVEQRGMQRDMLFTIARDDVEQGVQEMIPFVRLMCLNVLDAYLLEAVFRSDVWGFMELPVSRTNEELVCESVIACCQARLDDLCAAGGAALTENETQSERRALAQQWVSGEKEVLEKIVAVMQEAEDSLDTLEYYQERRLRDLDLLRPVDESEIVDSGTAGVRRGTEAFDQYY